MRPPHASAEAAEPSTRPAAIVETTAARRMRRAPMGLSFPSLIAVGRPERRRRFPPPRNSMGSPMLRPMQLNPTEEDRLRIFTAAQLARATLDRGVALNAPEAVAVLCDEMHLAARSGASWEEVRDAGIALAATTPVLDGVAELIPEIRLEVLLDEGTRLVVLRDPFGAGQPGI